MDVITYSTGVCMNFGAKRYNGLIWIYNFNYANSNHIATSKMKTGHMHFWIIMLYNLPHTFR